ncbi:MAG: hypothetical protein ABIP06_12765, partial [Pyrinomonadaceae bacterium]
MLKRILILVFVCIAKVGILGQTEKYTAPVKWERYKISDYSVSLLLPKLPILLQKFDLCSETQVNEYAVYAEGVVYGFNVNSQANQPAPSFCVEKRKFSQQNFTDRVQEIKHFLRTDEKSVSNQNGFETIKFNNNQFTYWLINDYKNKRWFELWVSEKNDSDSNIKNFVNSIKFENLQTGIEIGKGSDRTLGDETIAEKNEYTLPEKEAV